MNEKKGDILFKFFAGFILTLAAIGILLFVLVVINERYLEIFILFEIGIEKAAVSLILLCMSIFLAKIKTENKVQESVKKINIIIFSLTLLLSLLAAGLVIADFVIGHGIDFNANSMEIVHSITSPNSVLILGGVILLAYSWFKLKLDKIGKYYSAIILMILYPIIEIVFWNFSYAWLEINIDRSYISLSLLALTGLLLIILPLKNKVLKKKKNEEEVRL